MASRGQIYVVIFEKWSNFPAEFLWSNVVKSSPPIKNRLPDYAAHVRKMGSQRVLGDMSDPTGMVGENAAWDTARGVFEGRCDVI